MTSQILTLTADPEAGGQRLDRWLAETLPDRSRSEIQRWIKEGLVQVNGQPARASLRLEPGMALHLLVPAIQESTITAQAIPLDILFENDDLLVIHKPAGMVVHPAAGHDQDTLVNAVLYHCPQLEGVGGERRPGIVHRLDKDTSGLMVVAKNDRALRNLQAQFKARTVHKAYIALVEGQLTTPRGRINAPIGRHPIKRKEQAVLPPDPMTGASPGRSALTEYTALKAFRKGEGSQLRYFTLVDIRLHTGRTHQIRVHFAWLTHPLVGDTLYGYRRQHIALNRHFLHAHTLAFHLPDTGELREFHTPLPGELETVLKELEEIG